MKYPSSQLLGGVTEWDARRIEQRQVGGGAHNPLTSECTELVVILSGQATVRRTGDGQKQECLALPGTHRHPCEFVSVPAHPHAKEDEGWLIGGDV